MQSFNDGMIDAECREYQLREQYGSFQAAYEAGKRDGIAEMKAEMTAEAGMIYRRCTTQPEPTQPIVPSDVEAANKEAEKAQKSVREQWDANWTTGPKSSGKPLTSEAQAQLDSLRALGNKFTEERHKAANRMVA